MPSQTRKIHRKDPIVKKVEPVENYKPTHDDLRWIRIVQQGKRYFGYMIHNFKSMFDRETRIKHFDILPFRYGQDVDELKELYSDEIQKELVPWIKKEYEEGRLTNYIYWKNSRGAEYNDIYFGYRKLFEYKEYYYQLSFNFGCEDCDECKDCRDSVLKSHIFHFELIYYDNAKEIDERGKKCISTQDKYFQPDMMITDNYWKRKL
jgi:hypothetical protein